MTIQEVEKRKENRAKNKKLIADGRVTVADGRVIVDDVQVLNYYGEKDYKEHLNKFDLLQLKEEEEARNKARKEHQEKKESDLLTFNEFLNDFNFMLDAEDMNITTMAGDFVDFIEYGDIKKILEYKEENKTTYIELLKEKEARNKNWDNNIKALEEAEKGGIIDSYNYRGFNKGGRFYYVDDYFKYRNLDDRGGIVNFIIKITHEEEEEKAKQEEARQAEEDRIIKSLNANGVNVKTLPDGSTNFYYKRSKVLHLDWYYKIVMNHNGTLTINSDVLDLLKQLEELKK